MEESAFATALCEVKDRVRNSIKRSSVLRVAGSAGTAKNTAKERKSLR